MYLILLRCTLENVWDGTFSVLYICLQLKIKVGLGDSLVVQYVLMHI